MIGIGFLGNCGNLSAAVGPYAIASGVFSPNCVSEDSQALTMRIWNSNTGKLIRTTFPVREGVPQLEGGEDEICIDGVEGATSKVTMDYLQPGGARTGKLFPTGNKRDSLIIHSDGSEISVTLFDCTNPTVYVRAEDLDMDPTLLPVNFPAELLSRLERIRQGGATLMRLDPNVQAQPKICIVAPAERYLTITGEFVEADTIDLIVRAISMQQPHQAVPMTVAMATAAAAMSEATIVYEVSRRSHHGQICVGHPSGRLLVGADMTEDGEVTAVKAFRTVRFLMKGDVFC